MFVNVTAAEFPMDTVNIHDIGLISFSSSVITVVGEASLWTSISIYYATSLEPSLEYESCSRKARRSFAASADRQSFLYSSKVVGIDSRFSTVFDWCLMLSMFEGFWVMLVEIGAGRFFISSDIFLSSAAILWFVLLDSFISDVSFSSCPLNFWWIVLISLGLFSSISFMLLDKSCETSRDIFCSEWLRYQTLVIFSLFVFAGSWEGSIPTPWTLPRFFNWIYHFEVCTCIVPRLFAVSAYKQPCLALWATEAWTDGFYLSFCDLGPQVPLFATSESTLISVLVEGATGLGERTCQTACQRALTS